MASRPQLSSNARPSKRTRPRPAGREAERALTVILGGVLVAWGVTQRPVTGAVTTLLGGYLVYRGVASAGPLAPLRRSPRGDRALADGGGVEVSRAVTVGASPEALYRFWRQLDNLPRFMKHLESVTVLDDKRSRWVAKAPLGQTVTWEAEITEDEAGEVVAWRSLPGADVANAGTVRFKPAPASRGSEVQVTLSYRPPAGAVGAAVAKLLGEEPEGQIGEDLARFKALMETGEVPTTRGQPSGRGRD